MRILLAVLAVLIVVPTIEITILLAVGGQLGLGWTLVLLVASALVGSWLLRREGRRAYGALREALAAGRPPAVESAQGVLVLLGGVLMILPGFVTDLVGVVLIIPPVRLWIARFGLLRLARRLPPEVGNALLGPMPVRSHRVRARRRRRRGEPSATSDPRPAETTGADRAIEGEITTP